MYHTADDNTLVERAYNGDGWYPGGFAQRAILGTQAAVISRTSDVTQSRVHFQNGRRLARLVSGCGVVGGLRELRRCRRRSSRESKSIIQGGEERD